MRTIVVLMGSMVAMTGCGPQVEFLQYRGPQNWPTGSAFVRVVEGVEVYEGLPDRPYEVLGIIDIWHNQPFFANASATRDVLDYVKKNNGSAVVWLSKRLITSGSLLMEKASCGAAEIDTGHSTQPLIARTRGTSSAYSTDRGTSIHYQEDAWVEPQRSTLLVVRWK